MTTPVQVSEKKKRNTRHWKAIAKAAEALAAERLTMLDDAVRAGKAAKWDARFWRLVALGFALFAALTLAALARVVLS